MNKHMRAINAYSLFFVSLVVFPGCWFNSAKKQDDAQQAASVADADTSTELCSINGKPVITEEKLTKVMMQQLQQNPYFKGASVESLPAAIKENFFREMVKHELILAYAEKQGWHNEAEYQKELAEMMVMVKRAKDAQWFEKQIYDTITVSDSEVASDFRENKDRYVKTPGGVMTLGARFNTEAQAKAFAEKAPTVEAAFEKAATADKNASFKSFGRIGKENNAGARGGYHPAMAPIAIRDASIANNKFPRVEVVTSGKEYWAVLFADKKEAEHFELSEIKAQIADMLKAKKFREALEKKIQLLNDEMTVHINEDYFKQKEAEDVVDAAAKDSASAAA